MKATRIVARLQGVCGPADVCATIRGFRTANYGFYSSDTTQEGHADQDRERPVPRPRAAAPHAGQQARLRPVSRCATSARRALGSEVPRRKTTSSARSLDEREMQYLYKRRRLVPLHGHGVVTSRSTSSREALGDSVNYLIAGLARSSVEFYDERAGRHRAAADRRSEGRGHGRPASRARPPARRSSRRRSKPAWSCRCRRSSTPATRSASTPRPASTSRESEACDCEQRMRVAADARATTQHRALDRCTSDAMDIVASRAGWIEVITGSMFSGKSEELIRRLRRAQIARAEGPDLQAAHRRPLQRRPHRLAQRDADPVGERGVVARAARARSAPDTEVVGIDEGQFFDAELPAVCNTLADRGKRVIVAGLDQDYLGKPFEPMPQLLAIAEYITKTLAICMVCGEPGQPHAAARREQRARAGRRARAPTRRAAGTASIRALGQ